MKEKPVYVNDPNKKSGVSVPSMTEQEMDEYSAFSEFIGKYGASYSSKDEHMARFDIFQTNYRDIKSHNEKYVAGEVSYEKAVNQFADLSAEEFHARYLSNSFVGKPALKDFDLSENLEEEHESRPHMVQASHVPEHVDWYAEGKVSESVDQGGCGSCWAFTTATTLESLNAIQNRLDKVPRYSVQYLLDCDDINWGCDGGWMADSYEFTKEHGIVDWDAYPRGYQGRKNKCSDEAIPKSNRFRNAEGHEEDMISNARLRELVAMNPVGVAIYSNFGCLAGYSRGIVHDRDCDCSDPDRTDVNHAVTVIGYGKSEQKGCNEYWLIKNSWGAYWGDHGHFRLCADRDGRTQKYGQCQINSYVQWPTL